MTEKEFVTTICFLKNGVGLTLGKFFFDMDATLLWRHKIAFKDIRNGSVYNF